MYKDSTDAYYKVDGTSVAQNTWSVDGSNVANGQRGCVAADGEDTSGHMQLTLFSCDTAYSFLCVVDPGTIFTLILYSI